LRAKCKVVENWWSFLLARAAARFIKNSRNKELIKVEE